MGCAVFDSNVVVFPILSGVGFNVRLKKKIKIFLPVGLYRGGVPYDPISPVGLNS